MKRSIVPAAAILALGIGAPAVGQVVSWESDHAAPKQVSGNPNKIICETIERTGSRLAVEKMCMTALQWKEMKAGQREDVEHFQSIKNQAPSDGGGGAMPGG